MTKIYELVHGEWQQILPPLHPDKYNFLIRSEYGAMDWSGFRNLAECLKQIPGTGRPNGFYVIVEDR